MTSGAVWSLRGAVMRKEDALKILQAKLAEIEQDHDLLVCNLVCKLSASDVRF